MGDEVISTGAGSRLVPLFAWRSPGEAEDERARGTSRDRQAETEGD